MPACARTLLGARVRGHLWHDGGVIMRITNIEKRIGAFLLAVCILSVSVLGPLAPRKKVEGAALATAASLTGYFLTAASAVNILTNGGVSRVAGPVYDSIKQKIADFMGTGIYEDSSGNYVFTESASQELYDLLNANPGIDARVVSDFPSMGAWTNNIYITPDYTAWVRSSITDFNNQVFIKSWIHFYNGVYTTQTYVYNISDVAYFALRTGVYIGFYDVNGKTVACNYHIFKQTYTKSSGVFSSIDITNNSSNHSSSTQYNDMYNIDTAYLHFPELYGDSSNISNASFYCSHSMILGKDSAFGMALLKKDTGTIVNNNFTVLPPVQKTVIENNNWDNIYNSYVTNISNQKDIYYTESSGTDVTALRSVMKTFGDQIYQAIEEGATDISDRVNYTNEWLQKIYERVSMIYDWLSQGGSIGNTGGEAGGDVIDYSSILTTINANIFSLYDKNHDIYLTLTSIYAYLDTITTAITSGDANIISNMGTFTQRIVDAVNSINTGVMPDGSKVINYNNIINEMLTLPAGDITDYISRGQIFSSVAKSVAPLCFLAVVSSIVQGLSKRPAEGYAPRWEVPFKLQNTFVDVDESVEIDFSIFSSVQKILTAMWGLLFIYLLIRLTLPLIDLVLDIFS